MTNTQIKGVLVLEEPIVLNREDVRPTKSGTGYYTSIRVEGTAIIRHQDGSSSRVRLTGWWNPSVRMMLDAE